MQRWRLRFNLQEIDLPLGHVTLGRGPECPIAFEDSLVSRRHAAIDVSEDGCTIVDLGSRNGVRVNGARIDTPTQLRANDRIRLGRDELVLLAGLAGEEGATDPSSRPGRETAASAACASCGQEHVEGAVECRRCGAVLGHARLAAL